jgi:hypothetical protein
LLAGLGTIFLSMLIGNYFPAKKASKTDVARELRNL